MMFPRARLGNTTRRDVPTPVVIHAYGKMHVRNSRSRRCDDPVVTVCLHNGASRQATDVMHHFVLQKSLLTLGACLIIEFLKAVPHGPVVGQRRVPHRSKIGMERDIKHEHDEDQHVHGIDHADSAEEGDNS